MNSKKIFLIHLNVPKNLPDKDRLQRSYRETQIVQLTKKLGYDCKHFILSKEKRTITADPSTETYFFPVDDVEADFNKHTSYPLLEKIEKDKPDLVVFRLAGGFKLIPWLLLRSRHIFRFALIVGGGTGQQAKRFADYIFGENTEQLRRAFPASQRSGRVTLLPKIPHPAFLTQESDTKKIFDIVNIGQFNENKNQIMLLPLARKYKIALIGDGPCYKKVKSAAEIFGDNVYMPGNLSSELTAAVLRQSKLMVHTAYSEGLPRVFAEAFTCGVPVVASHEASPNAFEDGRQGRLVDHKHLLHTAESLIENPSQLNSMSQEAKRYAASQQTEQVLESVLKNAYFSIFSKEPMWTGSFEQRLFLRLILIRSGLKRPFRQIRKLLKNRPFS